MNTIETPRLILRGWKASDYLDFQEFISDERVAECAGRQAAGDIEECKRDIELNISSKQFYAIELKSENKVIGSIGMDDISPKELFYSLSRNEYLQGVSY